MDVREIKAGMMVETKIGTGMVIRVTRTAGTRPAEVRVDITHPFPRGAQSLAPRAVLREVMQTRGEKQDAEIRWRAWQRVLRAACAYAAASNRFGADESTATAGDLAIAEQELQDTAYTWGKL